MSRRQVGWGAAVGVVLGAANSAVINELHAGWPWWVAAALITGVSAVLVGRLADAGGNHSIDVGAGGVYIGQDNEGSVTTGHPAGRRRGRSGVWRRVATGAVFVGGRNRATGRIDTTGGPGEGPR
jgi:hypothetical protein